MSFPPFHNETGASALGYQMFFCDCYLIAVGGSPGCLSDIAAQERFQKLNYLDIKAPSPYSCSHDSRRSVQPAGDLHAICRSISHAPRLCRRRVVRVGYRTSPVDPVVANTRIALPRRHSLHCRHLGSSTGVSESASGAGHHDDWDRRGANVAIAISRRSYRALCLGRRATGVRRTASGQRPAADRRRRPTPSAGKTRGTASVVAVKTWQGWQPATGELVVSISQAEPRLLAGQTVRMVGMLQRPAPAMNPGEFDWESHYRRQRILTSIRVNHACDVRVMSGGVAPPCRRPGWAWRMARTRFLIAASGRPGVAAALSLGDRGPEIRDIDREFQRTGTSHLLSSSGLRMAVLGAMLYFICRIRRCGL